MTAEGPEILFGVWLKLSCNAALFSRRTDFFFHFYSVTGLFKDRTADAQLCVEYQSAICQAEDRKDSLITLILMQE